MKMKKSKKNLVRGYNPDPPPRRATRPVAPLYRGRVGRGVPLWVGRQDQVRVCSWGLKHLGPWALIL
jgi:hypothetical protein